MRAPVPESVTPGCRPAARPDVATPRASGPQPAAAIGRAGSNSRRGGSPLTSPTPRYLPTVRAVTADRSRTALARLGTLCAVRTNGVFRHRPSHGGSHAVDGSRTSSARRFIVRAGAVFPSVSGRRAAHPLGITRQRPGHHADAASKRSGRLSEPRNLPQPAVQLVPTRENAALAAQCELRVAALETLSSVPALQRLRCRAASRDGVGFTVPSACGSTRLPRRGTANRRP
jgi:hypothetical protein